MHEHNEKFKKRIEIDLKTKTEVLELKNIMIELHITKVTSIADSIKQK